jgi:hypothetical protein
MLRGQHANAYLNGRCEEGIYQEGINDLHSTTTRLASCRLHSPETRLPDGPSAPLPSTAMAFSDTRH